jgi:ribosomal protein L29
MGHGQGVMTADTKDIKGMTVEELLQELVITLEQLAETFRDE